MRQRKGKGTVTVPRPGCGRDGGRVCGRAKTMRWVMVDGISDEDGGGVDSDGDGNDGGLRDDI